MAAAGRRPSADAIMGRIEDKLDRMLALLERLVAKAEKPPNVRDETEGAPTTFQHDPTRHTPDHDVQQALAQLGAKQGV